MSLSLFLALHPRFLISITGAESINPGGLRTERGSENRFFCTEGTVNKDSFFSLFFTCFTVTPFFGGLQSGFLFPSFFLYF